MMNMDASHPPSRRILTAAHCFDARNGQTRSGLSLLIEGDRIQRLAPLDELRSAASGDAEVIDLGEATLLPGLVDVHTHLLASVMEGRMGYAWALLTKSGPYRALEGAAAARATLHAGVTSVRDVGNEGSGFADVALRDAIGMGLVEGPRMQVATRAIAAVGQYVPFGIAPDLEGFPRGAEMVSGVEEARRAVRTQLGSGADLIKVYADWDHPTLTADELRVVVQEAHRQKKRVAAHANTPEGIIAAVEAGVDSIEHGHRTDRRALEAVRKEGRVLVPTLSVMDHIQEAPPRGAPVDLLAAMIAEVDQAAHLAREVGVKIAVGSDISLMGQHGRNPKELASLLKRGYSTAEVLRAATLGGAELMGWEDRIGTLEPGRFADVVAVRSDPLVDPTTLSSIPWVMKGGVVVEDRLHAPAAR